MKNYYKSRLVTSSLVGSKQGVILIMVLAILTILVLLGVVFARLAMMERSTSRAYVDKIRAQMLAQSGIERAIAELKSLLAESPVLGYGDWAYYGEDLNRNGKLDPGEDTNQNGKLDIEDCPVEKALSPSFPIKSKDQPNQPALVNIKGKPYGYSGLMAGTYQPEGNQYVLKIIDLSSKIYINGGDPKNPAYPYNQVLARILNNLCKILNLPADTGTRIIAQRPSNGYQHEDEVATIIGEANYKRLKPYITAYSWVNPKVVRPVPLEQRPKRPYWPRAKINEPIYVMEQLNPGVLEFEPRAPVNVNTASVEVIQALLTDLQGFYLDQTTAGTVRLDGKMSNLGHLRLTSQITAEQARQIAQKIKQHRQEQGPFLTWADFFSFLDNIQTKISPPLTKEQLDVIKSNANPNNNLNDFNPNALIYRDIDKTDLTVYSTEFCLGSLGYFDIESVGRILGPDNYKLAENKIACRVQLLDFWHETTQDDFQKGTISEARGIIPATDGKSLQIYPETSRLVGYHADYDGYILLSTLKAPYKAGEENILLRASFDDLVKADVATGGGDAIPERDGPFVGRLITSGDKIGSLYPDGVYNEAYKCLRFPIQNNIHPFRGSLMFWYKPNWDPRKSVHKLRTLISMSRREGGGPPSSPLPQRGPSAAPVPHPPFPSQIQQVGERETQMFFFIYMPQWFNVPYAWMSFRQAYGFYYEGRPIDAPFPYSNCGASWDEQFVPEPHKWQLISMQWDFQGKGYRDCVRIYINGRRVLPLRHDRPNYHGENGAPIRNCQDLSKPDNPGIRIGEIVDRGWYAYPTVDPYALGHMSIDATVDELCVFDTMKSDVFNLLHYKIGRYYNYGDAQFTSAYRDFPQKVQLGTILSTIYLPRENECRGAEIEFQILGGEGGYLGEPISARIKNGGKIVDQNGNPIFVSGPIAYRIYFKEQMQDTDEPILESPVVDDITITYLLPSPRFISWRRY